MVRWYGADPAIVLPERCSVKQVNKGHQRYYNDCGVWSCMIATAVTYGQDLPYDVSEARHMMATLIVRAAKGEPVQTVLTPSNSSSAHVTVDKVDDVLKSDEKLAMEWQHEAYLLASSVGRMNWRASTTFMFARLRRTQELGSPSDIAVITLQYNILCPHFSLHEAVKDDERKLLRSNEERSHGMH